MISPQNFRDVSCVLLLTSSILVFLIGVSCIFDSPPAPPGYPRSIDATISFGEIGTPEMSEFTVNGELGIVAAGSKVVIIDIPKGEIAANLDIGVEIVDLGDTDIDGTAYLLSESKLFPLDLAAYTLGNPIEIGSGNRYLSISEGSNCAWVAGEESLLMVDMFSCEVTKISDSLFQECQGMIVFDNTLVVADGERNAFIAFEMEGWTELGYWDTPGAVLDIFFGYNGYISAIVENSNEIWYINPDGCILEEMITFPVNPVSGASMPNGEFAYGACPAMGLVIVSKSGEIAFTSGTFGVPVHIKVNRDGTRAIVCSEENEAVYILK